jgi:hypothetical protein
MLLRFGPGLTRTGSTPARCREPARMGDKAKPSAVDPLGGFAVLSAAGIA